MFTSQKAYDFIVDQETGGEAQYNRTEESTDWPGGRSGVTIGIGYDCGYETAAQIAADWNDKLSASEVAALQSVAGICGSPARSHAAELRGVIDVPWEDALDVFANRDVPKWEGTVRNALPNTDLLSGDSFGAPVSLAFNRGNSFDAAGDRYTEMRAIKALMAARNFAAIPAQFRSMERLWPPGTPNHTDLVRRREQEAELFENGLAPGATPQGSA